MNKLNEGMNEWNIRRRRDKKKLGRWHDTGWMLRYIQMSLLIISDVIKTFFQTKIKTKPSVQDQDQDFASQD